MFKTPMSPRVKKRRTQVPRATNGRGSFRPAVYGGEKLALKLESGKKKEKWEKNVSGAVLVRGAKPSGRQPLRRKKETLNKERSSGSQKQREKEN